MSEKNENKITIDLSTWSFTSDWNNIGDRFLLKATPIWFTWLSWIALLAAINFIQRKTDNLFIAIIFYLSLFMLGLYYDAAMRRIEFVGLPRFLRRKVVRLFIATVATALAYTAATLSAYVVTLLTVKT